MDNKTKHPHKKKKTPPLLIVLLSFLGIILIGSLLLVLPIATQSGTPLSYVDALFTATSAVCVTGLSTILDIGATFSIFGKIVIATLIQIGGLGIVTIAIYVLVILGIKITVTERYVIREALNQNSLGGMVKLIKAIIFTTLIIEGIGFVLNMIVFAADFPFWTAVGISAFHTVSSFNNAGFDILGATSLIPYADNVLLNVTTMVLIILGGLGFVVIQEVFRKRDWKHISVYAKIVIQTTAILIVFGALLIKFLSFSEITWMQAFFQSVTARTAGFSTVDMNILSLSSTMIIIILMFIGASPSSTGGGIKTTTAFVIFKSITCFLKGENPVFKNRLIDNVTRIKAFSILTLSLASIFVTFILIARIEALNPAYDNKFLKLIFETVSAFGTVGLSMGVTPFLYPTSKAIFIVLMFIGRLGPVTIFGVMNRNWGHPNASNIEYASESIIVG